MFIKDIYRKLVDLRWTIGFVENDIDGIIKGERLDINWVQCDYKDRWYADPFILDVTDEQVILLVEEFYYPIKRARITKLVVCRNNNKILSSKPILTLPTHLSYPAIVRKNGNIYIYPESGQSGILMLYRYHPDTDEVTEERLLINEVVADATYTDFWGEDIIFCTIPPDINKKNLYIYRKDSNGVYQRCEKITFEDNCARMAGDFFEHNGIIYRPAQDCNRNYGNGTVIQKVYHKNGKWSFQEVRRYYSDNPKYPLGIHTLNMYKGIIVVDAEGYWNPIIANITKKITGTIKNIGCNNNDT